MANYFNLTLDALAPVIKSFVINGGAPESAASCETFAGTKQVIFETGRKIRSEYWMREAN